MRNLIQICMLTAMNVWLHIHVCLSINKAIFMQTTYMYVCILHICMHTYIYTYIHTDSWLCVHALIHTCMGSHACLIQSNRHSSLPIYTDTYIYKYMHITHIFLPETYMVLELNISIIFRFAYFQVFLIFHTYGNLEIQKFCKFAT